jgi:hypothetical protein
MSKIIFTTPLEKNCGIDAFGEFARCGIDVVEIDTTPKT